MSFWDIVWFIIITFAFVAYLMVLFSIIGDLFRDRSTNGWVKALWIFCLIVFPFVTALVYLIARGRGMAERTAGDAARYQAEQEKYIRQVAARSAPADQIAAAATMLEQGRITEDEFDQLKARALSST
jgi:hypothetical protein